MSSPKKVIWSYWDRGLENAPRLVKACNKSWLDHNPGWEIRFLSQETIHSWISPSELLPKEKYPSIQKYSNHVRLLLLKKYGGVWVDADVFCLKPLDTWIWEAATEGVFMFSYPSQTRVIANWLILCSDISEKAVECISTIEHEYREYFNENKFLSNRIPVALVAYLEDIIGKLARTFPIRPIDVARMWNSRLFTKVFRFTPYFSFHYLVSKLCALEPNVMQPILSMKKIPAFGPLDLRRQLASNSIDEILSPWFPQELVVSKLNYRQLRDDNFDSWSSRLTIPG